MTILILQRTFEAPVSAMFKLMTRAEHVRTWWIAPEERLVDGAYAFGEEGPFRAEVQHDREAPRVMSGRVEQLIAEELVRLRVGVEAETACRINIQFSEIGGDRSVIKIEQHGSAEAPDDGSHDFGWHERLRRLRQLARAGA